MNQSGCTDRWPVREWFSLRRIPGCLSGCLSALSACRWVWPEILWIWAAVCELLPCVSVLGADSCYQLTFFVIPWLSDSLSKQVSRQFHISEYNYLLRENRPYKLLKRFALSPNFATKSLCAGDVPLKCWLICTSIRPLPSVSIVLIKAWNWGLCRLYLWLQL